MSCLLAGCGRNLSSMLRGRWCATCAEKQGYAAVSQCSCATNGKWVGPQAPGWVLNVPVPLIRETTRNNKEILTEMELRTSQELPEILVVERPRPPRAALSVAVPKIVLLDGIQQRGGVQTVDTPAPQVGEA